MKAIFTMVTAFLFLALLITTVVFGVGAAATNLKLFALTFAVVAFSIFAIPLGMYGLRLLKIYSFREFRRSRSAVYEKEDAPVLVTDDVTLTKNVNQASE